jgi:hypothetical protein
LSALQFAVLSLFSYLKNEINFKLSQSNLLRNSQKLVFR